MIDNTPFEPPYRAREDWAPKVLEAVSNIKRGDVNGDSIQISGDWNNPKAGDAYILEDGVRILDGGGFTKNTDGTFVDIGIVFKNSLQGVQSTYILAGDSTRAEKSLEAYYKEILNQFGIDFVDSARSGETSQSWIDESWGLQTAIDNTPNTGVGAVLEYSFGLNDHYLGRTMEEYKTSIIDGITQYISAKPDSTVLFVTPLYDNDQMETDLVTAMTEAAATLGFPVINATTVSKVFKGDKYYYQDQVHQTWYGERRIANFIFNSIVPSDSSVYLTLFERDAGVSQPNTNELNQSPFYESGYYYGGTAYAEPNWRRTPKFTVIPGTTINYIDTGGGNYGEAHFWDSQGGFISQTLPKLAVGETTKIARVPDNAVECAWNITSNSGGWTPNDISVKYVENSTFHRTLDQMNFDLNIKFKESNISNGKFIDSIGSGGSTGDSLKANADQTYTWQA